jgi:hypothetical protein
MRGVDRSAIENEGTAAVEVKLSVDMERSGGADRQCGWRSAGVGAARFGDSDIKRIDVGGAGKRDALAA